MMAIIEPTVTIAAIGGIVALCSCFSTVATVLSNNAIKRMEIAQIENHRKIAELEKNTNSIKDALVAATKLASFAEGSDAERSKQSEANANFEKGKAQAPKGV